ncbi:MAG TPA: hypothetical protein VMV18_03090 [bacterium]|nr:hypothetical protein [bacterium]
MMGLKAGATSTWFLLGGLLLAPAIGALAPLAAGAATPTAADTMYPDDANRQLKESIEDAYGLYILQPSRRNPKEKVEISDDNVEMWLYFDPRKPDYDRMKCEAYKWVLLGRFGIGGAQPFFEKFPKYKAVDLVVYRLASERTMDKDGNYHVSKTPSAYLKLRVSRAKAKALDWSAVKQQLEKAGEPKGPEPVACVRNAEKWVDAKWYSKEYFK